MTVNDLVLYNQLSFIHYWNLAVQRQFNLFMIMKSSIQYFMD